MLLLILLDVLATIGCFGGLWFMQCHLDRNDMTLDMFIISLGLSLFPIVNFVTVLIIVVVSVAVCGKDIVIFKARK